jgi:capsular exopolysaccharide synthesis family protein
MAKTLEALLKAEKENKMNYLKPVRQTETALAPLSLSRDLVQPSPDWCKELKTRLQTQFMNTKIQTLLFTSISHGSGCSSTTAGFATSLAKTFRNRVLLVDVNMRTPGIHKFFQDESSVGLFDLFSKRGPKIEKKMAQNLYVITCNQNIGEEIDGFFGSNRFMEFLSKMRENFDYVILDGPPVPACSESLVIGAKVDGVILTLESGKARRSVALKAKKEIEESGGKFLGVVLNKREYYIPKWIYKRL